MIAFDRDVVAQAVAGRAAEIKWNADRALLISRICDWQVDHPAARLDYDDGQPNADMRDMIDHVSRHTGATTRDVLMSFGAAHCLLCDTVPGFRPVLYSAWDRRIETDAHG